MFEKFHHCNQNMIAFNYPCNSFEMRIPRGWRVKFDSIYQSIQSLTETEFTFYADFIPTS